MSDRPTERTPQPLSEWRYGKGEVFQGMGGDFWAVRERLWNFDAASYERGEDGRQYEVTMDHHRREYLVTSLDPEDLESVRHRHSEIELAMNFDEDATREDAREHYREQREAGDE